MKNLDVLKFLNDNYEEKKDIDTADIKFIKLVLRLVKIGQVDVEKLQLFEHNKKVYRVIYLWEKGNCLTADGQNELLKYPLNITLIEPSCISKPVIIGFAITFIGILLSFAGIILVLIKFK